MQYFFIIKMTNTLNMDQANRPLKLFFKNIKCKIAIDPSSPLAIVVRIGSTYSQFTPKTYLNNLALQFREALRVPIQQKLVFDSSLKKEKCQILLYRFINVQQKQNKQLIGMASMPITPQLLQQQSKQIKITNTFDKQASVSFHVKIISQETDIFKSNQSNISSVAGKSDDSSINYIEQFKDQSSLKQSGYKITLLNDPISQKSEKAIRSGRVSVNGDSEKLNSQQNTSNFVENQKNDQRKRNQWMRHQKDSNENKLTNSKQLKIKPRSSSAQQMKDHEQKKQNKQLIQLCANLQHQNSMLINKIISLENTNPNKIQQLKKNSGFSIPNIPSKSPMIKKNIKVGTGFSVKSKQSGSTDLPQSSFDKMKAQKQQQNQKNRNQTSNESIGIYDRNIHRKQVSDLQFTRLGSMNRNENNISSANQKNHRKIILQHVNTFPEASKHNQMSFLSINHAIQVSYIPEYVAGYYPQLEQIPSISETEKQASKSYTKFNDSKKHARVGSIKKSFDSINYSVCELDRKDYAVQTQNSRALFQNDNGLSTFNGSYDAGQIKFTVNGKAKSQVPSVTQQSKQNEQKMTLQDLDRKINEKYRKNQKDLIKVKNALYEENRKLKIQQKKLQEQIQKKKFLSYDQFQKLRHQNVLCQKQINRYLQKLKQNQKHVRDITVKFQEAMKQNSNLQKEIKQQRKTLGYFVKNNSIVDDKEKQKVQERQSSQSKEQPSFSIALPKQFLNKSGLATGLKLTSLGAIQDSGPKLLITLTDSCHQPDKVRNSASETKMKNLSSEGNLKKDNVKQTQISKAVSILKQNTKQGSQKPYSKGLEQGNSVVLGTSRGEGNSYNSLNIPMSQNKKPKGRFEGTGHTIIKTNESYFK